MDFKSTRPYRNIYMPSARAADHASGEGAEQSIVEERCALLAAHGLQIPDRGTPGTAALYRFIDGEKLSRKDNLDLSRWLETAGPQEKAELLAAMQEREGSF